LTAHDAGKAGIAAREKREELAAASDQPADSDTVDNLTVQLRELELQAEKARRRAARLAVRAQSARQQALDLGLLPQQAAEDDDD